MPMRLMVRPNKERGTKPTRVSRRQRRRPTFGRTSTMLCTGRRIRWAWSRSCTRSRKSARRGRPSSRNTCSTWNGASRRPRMSSHRSRRRPSAPFLRAIFWMRSPRLAALPSRPWWMPMTMVLPRLRRRLRPKPSPQAPMTMITSRWR